MTSIKQLEANRENGLKGGVKTEEGKKISKYNAVKHGILKVVITDYEQGYYESCLQELIEELEPVGFTENMLVERIALCYLRLFRVAKAEGEFIKTQLHPFVIKHSAHDIINKMTAIPYDEITVEGYKENISVNAIQQLDQTLLRYDTTIENKLYRALHELQRIQAIRNGLIPRYGQE